MTGIITSTEAGATHRQAPRQAPLPRTTTGRLSAGRLVRGSLLLAALAAIAVACTRIDDPAMSRAAMIAGVCLVLWLTEAIPLFATTLLLWVAIALFMRPIDPRTYSTPRVLSSMANPVLALFFGGFALSVAGSKYGIDAYIAGWMLKASGGRRRVLLAALMAGTAVLSMWMSNIAAGAMMIATLRPLFPDAGADGDPRHDASFRRALLLGVAFAADFGGIATPIGTGPNLIAIGAVSSQHTITFLDWMRFGVPVAAVMLAAAYTLLLVMHRVGGRIDVRPRANGHGHGLTRRGWAVVAIFSAAVALWLLEPLHGVPSALVALGVAGVLFGSRLLGRDDLAHVEWDTLLLIAGGLTLGQLFDDSGLARGMAAAVPWGALSPTLFVLLLVFACASISAVASNTAASAVLIQIALGIAPTPSVAVLVALGASMGVPFVISTPPNAMVYGQGGVQTRDLLLPGTILMLGGCALLAMAGPPLLRWAGVP